MLIDDERLTIGALPDPLDCDGIFAFAMSFNGYSHYGSFEKCANLAKSKQRSTLTEIRNELFFAARASRHRGDNKFVQCYQELLPLIQQKLAQSSSA